MNRNSSTNQKNPNFLVRFFVSKGNRNFLFSLVSILIGILIGFIIMVCSSSNGGDPLQGLGILFSGPLTALNPVKALGNMIFYAVPLIFTGLSVAVAFKTGLFNIGAPGQFLMGTMVSLLIALNIDSTGNPTQGVFVWILALLAGMIAGVIWGMIPGFFKAVLGVNEVIVCIMTNWIGANMVTWILSTQQNIINTSSGKSGYLITTAVTGNGTPDIGFKALTGKSYLDIGIIIAIVVAVMVWLLMNKTTLGYSMKACGLNKFSAKYAGMNEKFNIIIAMAIAGGLAALGGCFYYLNPGIELQFDSIYQNLPSYGFDGIPAALLANCNPVGVIFSALFIRYLASSGSNLASAGYNKYFADIIIACIIYLAGFTNFFRSLVPNLVSRSMERKSKKRMGYLTEGLLEESTEGGQA